MNAGRAGPGGTLTVIHAVMLTPGTRRLLSVAHVAATAHVSRPPPRNDNTHAHTQRRYPPRERTSRCGDDDDSQHGARTRLLLLPLLLRRSARVAVTTAAAARHAASADRQIFTSTPAAAAAAAAASSSHAAASVTRTQSRRSPPTGCQLTMHTPTARTSPSHVTTTNDLLNDQYRMHKHTRRHGGNIDIRSQLVAFLLARWRAVPTVRMTTAVCSVPTV